MPATPEIQPLSYKSRRRFFFFLITLFLIALPVFAFYAAGYRFDVFGDSPNGILTTGGMYVVADAENTQIFLDEQEVRNLRVFRNAAYIQGLTPGIHRLHVQAPGLQTWVKELPVLPHIVTEATAFNLPEQPQVRPVTEYIAVDSSAVYLDAATTTLPFLFASTTVPLLATSTSATSTFFANPEFAFVNSLFGTTSTSTGIVRRVVEGVNEAFRFATEVGTSTEASATTSVVVDNVRLYERGGEVYARFEGDEGDIPFYFCAPYGAEASSTALFGSQFVALANEVIEIDEKSVTELSDSERLCRDEIRIDRRGQEVQWFGFFPNNSDLVLMQLEDGLYVVEIDDRAWQNTQLLYPGEDIEVTVSSGQIFVNDSGHFAEVLTELISL